MDTQAPGPGSPGCDGAVLRGPVDEKADRQAGGQVAGQPGGQTGGQAADVREMRSAPRFSLMLRAAKLITRDGEYLCIVRDVSETGTRLRLFHEPPPDDVMLLELGNGSVYPVQAVWRRDGHAGFRFASDINVAEFMDEAADFPRRALRLRLARSGRLTAQGQACPVSLVNVSQHGVCIEAGVDLPVGLRVKVEVSGMPPRIGNVCWRRGQQHGVVCQQAFALDELAEMLFAMQPYSPVADLAQDIAPDAVANCA